MIGLNFYAAEASGYIKVPEDGVYVLSTLFDQLWVDGEKLIDNGREVKKHSRQDAGIALRKGYHRVTVRFLSNVRGGWTTARNRGEILIRKVQNT